MPSINLDNQNLEFNNNAVIQKKDKLLAWLKVVSGSEMTSVSGQVYIGTELPGACSVLPGAGSISRVLDQPATNNITVIDDQIYGSTS